MFETGPRRGSVPDEAETNGAGRGRTMDRLKGKVALITGAARGQGRAHALAFAREGADVIAVDNCRQIGSVPYSMSSDDDLEKTTEGVRAAGRRALALRADVRSRDELSTAVASATSEFGGIDVVLINHGIWTRSPLWELSEESWQDMIDVNLTGAWRTLAVVAPVLIRQRSGSVILVSSTDGVEGQNGAAHYTAAKAGVLGLMRSAAQELAEYGIRCNAICPGFVDTPMTDWQGCYDLTGGKPGSTRDDQEKHAYRWNAIGGIIQPEEISGATVFLASDEASRITGVVLPVDAGHLVLPAYNFAKT